MTIHFGEMFRDITSLDNLVSEFIDEINYGPEPPRLTQVSSFGFRFPLIGNYSKKLDTLYSSMIDRFGYDEVYVAIENRLAKISSANIFWQEYTKNGEKG